MIKPLTAAEQEEFNRIDSEVTSFGTATGKELGSWQGFGEASKALFSPSASAGTALGMAASAPAVLWDAGKSFVTGEKTTEASDAMFKAVDDYARSAETFWRPNPDAMGGVARVGSMGMQLIGTVPQIVGAPSVAISGMTFSPTMDAIDQGASPEAVAKIGATTLGVNAVSWALPAAWGKTMLGRVGTGAASNAVLGAVQEGFTGSVLLAEGNKAGENYRWDNYENRFFELAIGGLIGAKFGADANIKAENDAATAPLDQPLPSKAEMAETMAHINQDHFTNTTLPGLPMNSDGIRQHTSALDTAIRQVLNGEPVNIADTLDMNNFLARPEHRPPTYIPASPSGKSAGNYGIGFLSDPSVYDNFTQYRHALEVGGLGPSAKNPLSSATGNGQFIESTWLSLIKQNRPAWAKGLNRDELLTLRTDPEITAEVLKLQDQGHAKAFMDSGLPVNFYTMYSAHHFGIGKGKAFARADGDTPMTAILSPEQIDANGHLRKMTKDQAQAYWDKQAKKQGAQGESLFVQREQKADNAIKPTEQGETYANGLPKQLPEIDGSREADLLNQSLAIIRSTAGDGSGQQHAGVRVIDQGFVPEPISRGLAAFTEATGVPVTLVRNLSPEIKDFHGATVPGENRIYLNVDSSKPLVVAAGHELGHRMKEAAPDLYKPMQAEMKRQGFVPKYAAERKLSNRKALPELTNDAIGDAMGDTKFLNRMAKENPTLFHRVASMFKEYLDGLLAKLGATDYGANRYMKDVEAFRDQLAYALGEFGKRNGKVQRDLFDAPAAKGGEAMFSDKAPEFNVLKSTMDGFAKSVDQAIAGSLPRGHLIKMGRAPSVLKSLGLRDLELIVPKNEITEQKHGIPMDVIKQMPALIADPVAVFKSASKDNQNRIVVVTEATHNGGPVVAVIEPDAATGMGKVHFVTSFHAKTSPEKSIKSWVENGLLLYRNKEKGSELWAAAGVQFPRVPTNQNLSDAKILTNEDIVKPTDAKALFSDKYDDTHRPIPEDIPDFVPEPEALKPDERFAMPQADQVKADIDHAKQAAEYEKQRNLRQKALSIIAGDKVRRAIIAFPGQPMQAIDHIIARSADAKGSVMSVESQAKAIAQDAYRQLIPMLEATAPKFFGLLESTEGVHQLVMELHGQKTGNPDAKNGAAAFRKVADTMKTRFNRAGGDIGTLEDWGMPHSHSQYKVALAGKDAWVKKTLPKMNRAKYDMSDAELVEFLGEVWKTIAQNGVNKLVPGTFTGDGKVANRGNKARQLHFKDGEAYLDYQKDFGESSPYEILTSHINSMAHDIAMIETLGPNPDQMIRTIIDEAYIASVDADPVNLPKHDKQKKWLETLYREVSGKARPVHNRKLATAFQIFRADQVASKLGGAAITAGTDHGTMHTAAVANNLPQMQLFANEVAAFNPANAVERERINRMGLGLSSIIGSVNRFSNEVSNTGLADKVASVVIRASGLAATTDMRRRAYGVTMMDAIGSVVSKSKSLADLDPNDNRILLSKGITDTDFSVWKMAELEDMGANHTILTPDSIYAIPDAKLSGIVDEFGDAIDPDILRQQAVTKLLGATLEEVDIGIIEPGARERAKLYGNSIRGTWKGELVISLMQFKSFPASMILKHWQRTMSEATPMKRAQVGALLMASTTIAGMATLQLMQVLMGKDPKDMTKWETWVSALLKGGGLSLFGDYLLQDKTENGNTILASMVGPVGSTFEDIYSMTRGNLGEMARGEDTHIGAEMVKFAKSNTPFANLWYTRAATDHLIVNELQEMASPGYLKKMERRAAKEYNETYYWKPGTPFPQRAPDFDKATGQ